jgi:hypothetical protein
MTTTISTAGLPQLSTAEKTFKTAIETAIDAAGLVTMSAATSTNDGYMTKEFATLMADVTASNDGIMTKEAFVTFSTVATATNDGYLDKDDFATFTAKQTATLSDGKIWVGNSSNVAAAVAVTGPIDISNAGLTSWDTAWVNVASTDSNGEIAIPNMTTNGGIIVLPRADVGTNVAVSHQTAAAGKITLFYGGTTNVAASLSVAYIVAKL